MSLEEFRALYERHVGHVVSGNVKAALADMVPENMPAVFDGVDFPKGQVDHADIKDVRADGDRRIGDAIYHTPSGLIGLRSIWERRDGEWKAAVLENFPVAAEDVE